MKIKIEFENLDDATIQDIKGLHCEGITQNVTYTSENRHTYDRARWEHRCDWFLAILPPEANVECDFYASGKMMLFDRIENGRDVVLVQMPEYDRSVNVAMPYDNDAPNKYQTCARRGDGSLVLCIGKDHHAVEFV